MEENKESTFSKIIDIAKGKINDTADKVVEENQLVLLRQKIREGKDRLNTSTDSLTTVIATQKKFKREMQEIDLRIEQNELLVKECLNKNEEALAEEIVEKIIDLKNEREFYEQAIQKTDKSIDLMEKNIEKVRETVESMIRSEHLFLTQETLNKSLQYAKSVSGLTLSHEGDSTEDLIKSINDKLTFDFDKINAENEIKSKDEALEEKLNKANIVNKNQKTKELMDKYKQQMSV